ncbi:hypothetical protein LCGC14_1095790 [marine sediment metagenome]|uniref:C1q domain-containing protein n=1 Tax=marine sediment metagenome TaxID=412755 RepID=A0A0F9MAZ6_9ZZZZ
MATIDELTEVVTQLVDENKKLRQSMLKLTRRRQKDPRISLLTTSFDIEDAVFPPTVRVTNGAQAILHDTLTVLTFSTETWDTDNMHSTSTNTGRLVATTAGKYRYSAHVRIDAHGTGFRILRIRANGSTVYQQIIVNDTPNDAVDMEITGAIELAATEYIELQFYQNSTITRNTETTSGGTSFCMEWIAP